MQNPCNFTFYSDYLAHIARSGIQSAQALFQAIAPLQKINILTFDVFTDAMSARDELDFQIRTSYENVFSNMYSVNPLETSFVALADHISKFEHYTVNDFLTAYGITVLPAYASISSLLNQPIHSSNVRNYGESSDCN
jgi:hypothetical protein